jgi:hypothetical protein
LSFLALVTLRPRCTFRLGDIANLRLGETTNFIFRVGDMILDLEYILRIMNLKLKIFKNEN